MSILDYFNAMTNRDIQGIIKKCPQGYRYYAAAILSQCRVVINGTSSKMRRCSTEICLFKAKSDRDALRLAKKIGRSKEVSYENTDGNMVHVEFIGITDIEDITFRARFDEVYGRAFDMLNPMERKEHLTLSDEEILKRLKE